MKKASSDEPRTQHPIPEEAFCSAECVNVAQQISFIFPRNPANGDAGWQSPESQMGQEIPGDSGFVEFLHQSPVQVIP